MWVFCARSLFCVVVLGVLSSLAITLRRKRELAALLCVVAVCALCLFHTVPWVSLQFDVTFPGNSHLLNGCQNLKLIFENTVKLVLSGNSRRQKLVFKTDYRLMQVKSIA